MFETLTTAESIFFSIIVATTLYGSIKLKSLIGITAWTFNIITLIGVLQFELEMIYFWFTLIIVAISLVVASTVKASYQ
jgi:hypothetical protein